MKKVKWCWDWEVYVPLCPYCNEYAYEKDHCVFCGKPYKWVDKSKDIIIEQGEYVIVQSSNKHISIYKNGEFVYHASYTKKLTKRKLKKYLASYIENMPKIFKMADEYIEKQERADESTKNS